jgi:hypothetical protein
MAIIEFNPPWEYKPPVTFKTREQIVGELESKYREWLVSRIEGMTGALHGEGKELFVLYTESLEKLYRALTDKEPREEYVREGY